MMTARMGAVVSGRLSAATLQRLCVRMREKAGRRRGEGGYTGGKSRGAEGDKREREMCEVR